LETERQVSMYMHWPEHAPGMSVSIFNTSRPPERQALTGHDIIISFLPGPAFLSCIPELVASRIPVVSGSTGFEWPDGREAFSNSLAESGLHWLHASNFSLGMSLIHEMIQVLGMAGTLYDEHSFAIHEIHHQLKKDAPSGTALSWHRWLGASAEVTSERTGDVIGEHSLTLTTPFERIRIHHSARDRKLFASGALWAARQVLYGEFLPGPGLHDFQQMVLRGLRAQNGFHQSTPN
jgi:4-hydroxy-tetrahydrodipicolinate reductase